MNEKLKPINQLVVSVLEDQDINPFELNNKRKDLLYQIQEIKSLIRKILQEESISEQELKNIDPERINKIKEKVLEKIKEIFKKKSDNLAPSFNETNTIELTKEEKEELQTAITEFIANTKETAKSIFATLAGRNTDVGYQIRDKKSVRNYSTITKIITLSNDKKLLVA